MDPSVKLEIEDPNSKTLFDKAYETFIDGGPARVSIVERIDEPMTVWQSIQNTLISSLKGAAISGFLSGLVGGAIAAFSGINGAEKIVEQMDAGQAVTMGGKIIPGIGMGPYVTIASDSEVLRNALAVAPQITSTAIAGINGALNVGTTAAMIGAGVGAIKGGWADRITKERELVAAHPVQEQTIT